MNLAIRSVTGSEYSIKEDYNQYSDTLYDDIERYVVEDLKLIPTSLLILPIEEKVEIAHKIKLNKYPDKQLQMVSSFLSSPPVSYLHLSHSNEMRASSSKSKYVQAICFIYHLYRKPGMTTCQEIQ